MELLNKKCVLRQFHPTVQVCEKSEQIKDYIVIIILINYPTCFSMRVFVSLCRVGSEPNHSPEAGFYKITMSENTFLKNDGFSEYRCRFCKTGSVCVKVNI